MTVTEQFNLLKSLDRIASYSDDQQTKIGAILYSPSDKIRIFGWNHVPVGIEPKASDHLVTRPRKYHYFVHAERHCIYQAAAIGVKTAGGRLFVLGPPCADCVRACIEAQLSAVVMRDCDLNTTPARWQISCGIGLEMLQNAGIAISWRDYE